MKNIILIGNSSLEDSIAWKLNQENNIGNIFISPGNGGAYSKPKVRNISLNFENKNEIKEFLDKEKISYVIASSYKKLTSEFEQALKESEIPMIGPPSNIRPFFSSRIKIKNFLKKFAISSPSFEIIESLDDLSKIVEKFSVRKLIYTEIQKGWKGIYLLESKGQGVKILESIGLIEDERSNKFLIETYQKGEEFSATIALDSMNYILFPVVRVYTKSFDNDFGLYTSGMGGFTPCPSFSNNDITNLNEKIIYPLIEGLKTENILFKGFLTIDFIKSNDRLMVLNIIPSICSPEIETILPLMNSSFNELCLDMISQNLITYMMKVKSSFSLSVVLASKGYPIEFEKGVLIAGLEKKIENINIFHNKTSIINYSKNRGFITTGGRVLTINSVNNNLEEVRKNVYNVLENNILFFDGNFYRSDIAEKYYKKLN